MCGKKRQVLRIYSSPDTHREDGELVEVGAILAASLGTELGWEDEPGDAGFIWDKGLSCSLFSVGCFGLFVLWFSKLLCLTMAGEEPGRLVKRSFSQQNTFWPKGNKGLPLFLGQVGGHTCGPFRFSFLF